MTQEQRDIILITILTNLGVVLHALSTLEEFPFEMRTHIRTQSQSILAMVEHAEKVL